MELLAVLVVLVVLAVGEEREELVVLGAEVAEEGEVLVVLGEGEEPAALVVLGALVVLAAGVVQLEDPVVQVVVEELLAEVEEAWQL